MSYIDDKIKRNENEEEHILHIELTMGIKLSDKELKELMRRLNRKLKKYEGKRITFDELSKIITQILKEIYR